jgi:hypothetical protein
MEYSKFSVKELKTILEQKGLKGVSKYKKDELISTLLKLETIEKEENESHENDIQIPLPPPLPISSVKEEINEEQNNQIIQEGKNDQENTEEMNEEDKAELEIELEKELEKPEPEHNETKHNERIMDPVRLFENFKPSLAVSESKKSDILKGMIQYKTAQKLMERQEIKKDMDKLATDIQILRQEYLTMLDVVKKDLKEVRESFLMAMLIILHNFAFMPLDKLPIFKGQKK